MSLQTADMVSVCLHIITIISIFPGVFAWCVSTLRCNCAHCECFGRTIQTYCKKKW